MAPRQCVILVGGKGTRLGALGAETPKPLLPVGGRPFLDTLLWHLVRFGFERVLLLAGHKGEMVARYAADTPYREKLDIRVRVEAAPLGTAGSLKAARNDLDPSFLLLNGDSVFDFNWLDLAVGGGAADGVATLALRPHDDLSRYGTVVLAGDRVAEFRAVGGAGRGLVNAGVYLVRSDIVPHLPEEGSLERDVLPRLAASGRVGGRVYGGFFIDIGVPAAFEEAQHLVPASLGRPAISFTVDSVLAALREGDRLRWLDGAQAAIKLANDRGWFAFLVAASADTPVPPLIRIQQELRAAGAHFDAPVEEYRGLARGRSILVGRPPVGWIPPGGSEVPVVPLAGVADVLRDGLLVRD